MTDPISPGEFILDRDAAHADEVGASENLGVRGLAIFVYTHDDHATGERVDRLVVAVNRHGTLDYQDIDAATVVRHAPLGRIDAKQFRTLANKTITHATLTKTRVDERVYRVQQLAVAAEHQPHHHTLEPGQSILDRADTERRADPEAERLYQQMLADYEAKRAERRAGHQPGGTAA